MDTTFLTALLSIALLFSIIYIVTVIRSKKRHSYLENKIKENLQRFRTIFDGVNYAIIIHDIEGKIIDANKNALDLYGITQSDLSLITIKEDTTAPSCSKDRLNQILGQVANGEMAIFPWIAKKPHTGEIFDVEVALRKIEVPGQDLILATIRNMTEPNTAAAEIRKLAAVVEQVDESVVVCDKDARIIYVNPYFERVTGYSALEILGEKPGFLKSGAHDSQFYKTMWNTIGSGNTWHGILRNKRKDGDLFDEEVTIFPIKNTKAEITGYAAVKRDITQKLKDELALKSAKDSADMVNMELESAIAAANAMSEKAIEASKAKSEFIASVSHELRTPLNIILGSIELMSETIVDNEQEKYLKVCRNACESLLDIVSGILDISKIEAGQLYIENMEFEPNALINDIILLNEFRAKSKNIDLTSEISKNVPENLSGDPARIRQILINLVNNAIKFTEKGSVQICVETVNPEATLSGSSHNSIYLKFSVIDTGIGIDIENIDRIFDEFIQADATITRKFGGTGLGLTISKKLVNLMGGTIWAESEEGKGSKFIFTVRCHTAGVSTEKTKSLSKNKKIPTKPDRRLKILLAEDIADNRMLISKMISEIADVETVENGAQAVERFKSESFDLIIMDIQMPELDGYTAARFIKGIEAEESRAETPLIALTAFATSEELKKSIEAGFTGHVTKPVKKATIIDAICHAVSEISDNMKIDDYQENNTLQNATSFYSGGLTPSPKDYTVIADPAIEELIPFFIENRKHDLVKLEKAINEKDFASIMILGHSLKGTGGSYGFYFVSKIGAALEDAATAKDSQLLTQLKDQMTDYLEKVHVRFE